MIVLAKKSFIVKETKNGFIVINTKKKFKEGHTHVDTFRQARFLVEVSIKRVVPKNLSYYLLTSLIRINSGEYRGELIEKRKYRYPKSR